MALKARLMPSLPNTAPAAAALRRRQDEAEEDVKDKPERSNKGKPEDEAEEMHAKKGGKVKKRKEGGKVEARKPCEWWSSAP